MGAMLVASTYEEFLGGYSLWFYRKRWIFRVGDSTFDEFGHTMASEANSLPINAVFLECHVTLCCMPCDLLVWKKILFNCSFAKRAFFEASLGVIIFLVSRLMKMRLLKLLNCETRTRQSGWWDEADGRSANSPVSSCRRLWLCCPHRRRSPCTRSLRLRTHNACRTRQRTGNVYEQWRVKCQP